MTGPRMWGLVAEFESPDALLAAAHRVREAGYRRIDACVPFPVEGLTEALGFRPTWLPLLVLTGAPISEVYQVIQLGVTGVVSKEKPASFLLKAIEHVNAGEVWLDRSMTAQVVREVLFPDDGPENGETARIATLTRREREVITLVGTGSKNEQIAGRLSITLTTVKHHLTSIFGKLGVTDRFGLVFYAYKHGLASPPRGLG